MQPASARADAGGRCNLTSGNLVGVGFERPSAGHASRMGYTAIRLFRLAGRKTGCRRTRIRSSPLSWNSSSPRARTGWHRCSRRCSISPCAWSGSAPRRRPLRAQRRTARGYANGYKSKTLDTTAGTVTVDVPKAAGADEPFYPQSLERGRRSSRAVMLAIAEMYVQERLPTRDAAKVMAEFGLKSLSSTQVSLGCRSVGPGTRRLAPPAAGRDPLSLPRRPLREAA